MAHAVKVYPNLLEMRRYEAGLKRQRAEAAQNAQRRYGRGTEFESLRDYVPDDEFRAIDWKATARTGKLTSRQYQQERSQNVIIALDCGRIMGPVVDGLTKLDHCINAAAMLSHVATMNGDRVGVVAFSNEVDCFVPPKPGKAQVNKLLSVTYDLRDAEGDSDYAKAFSYLSRRWTRRSLIVLFSDVLDPESSKPLTAQMSAVARKHLCILATPADESITQAAYQEAARPNKAFEAAAARQVLHSRRVVKADLGRVGIDVLDTPPKDFTTAVVARYFDIKRRSRL